MKAAYLKVDVRIPPLPPQSSSKKPLTTETAFAAAPTRRKPDRHARLFDEHIYPLFGQRLGDMLLAAADVRPGSSVLEVGCGSGVLTAQIAQRLDAEGRVVAVDGST